MVLSCTVLYSDTQSLPQFPISLVCTAISHIHLAINAFHVQNSSYATPLAFTPSQLHNRRSCCAAASTATSAAAAVAAAVASCAVLHLIMRIHLSAQHFCCCCSKIRSDLTYSLEFGGEKGTERREGGVALPSIWGLMGARILKSQRKLAELLLLNSCCNLWSALMLITSATHTYAHTHTWAHTCEHTHNGKKLLENCIGRRRRQRWRRRRPRFGCFAVALVTISDCKAGQGLGVRGSRLWMGLASLGGCLARAGSKAQQAKRFERRIWSADNDSSSRGRISGSRGSGGEGRDSRRRKRQGKRELRQRQQQRRRQRQ